MKKQFILLFLVTFLMGYPQDFRYRTVDRDIAAKTQVSASERSDIRKQYFAGAKSLVDYLPPNADKSGNKDYTDLLQKGLDGNSTVIFPDFPVLVAPKGLQLKSNSKILFLPNSKIKVKPNDKEFYAALNFENVENVQLYFANLEGERYEHQNSKGEWGMGIYIVHSKNISIYKPHITRMWGDGIYIGKLEGCTSKNITIDGGFIDENRRNGISIIAGNNIKIANSVISNTYGTIPEYGIDIEPNKPEDELKGISLVNNTTFNNNKGGVLFALDNLQGQANNPVEISISNHTDYFSKKGIEFYIDRGYRKFVSPISGKISIDGANLFNNDESLVNNDSQKAQITLNLNNIKVNNKSIDVSKINNFVNQYKAGKLNKIKPE